MFVSLYQSVLVEPARHLYPSFTRKRLSPRALPGTFNARSLSAKS
jgi:hypothetical protein